MKRFMILLALCLALALSGCAGKPAPSDPAPTEAPEEPTKTVCDGVVYTLNPDGTATILYAEDYPGGELPSQLEVEGRTYTVAPYVVADGMLLSEDGTRLIRYPAGDEREACAVPEGVVAIEYNAFTNAKSLRSVTLPDSLREIGRCAFYNCASLESIQMSDAVTQIGDQAFSGCESLVSLALPRNLERLGQDAFMPCRSLESVVLPDTGIPFLQSRRYFNEGIFRLREDGAGYVRKDNAIFNGDGSKLLALFIEDEEEYEVPGGVSEIADYAVAGHKNSLRRIALPEGLKRIGTEAFKECRGLEAIRFPASLTEIGVNAFWDCEGLSSAVELPEGLTALGREAFKGCAQVPAAVLPDGLKELPFGAFRECAALAEVRLPEGLEKICDSAFSGCVALTEVTVRGNGDAHIGKSAFAECAALERVELAGVSSIGVGAFNKCESLSLLQLSEGLSVIEADAFRDCDALYDVVLPEGLTALGDYAFYGTSVVPDLPQSLSTVGIFSLPKPGRALTRHYARRVEAGTLTLREEKGDFNGKLIITYDYWDSLDEQDREETFRQVCSDALFKRLARTIAEADTLVWIYPEYRKAGEYTIGLSATGTSTVVAVYDLHADTGFRYTACYEGPAQTIIVGRESGTGAFRPEVAIEDIEAAIG